MVCQTWFYTLAADLNTGLAELNTHPNNVMIFSLNLNQPRSDIVKSEHSLNKPGQTWAGLNMNLANLSHTT